MVSRGTAAQVRPLSLFTIAFHRREASMLSHVHAGLVQVIEGCDSVVSARFTKLFVEQFTCSVMRA